MRILFAGPSVVGVKIPEHVELRGPAVQGDIVDATLAGAQAIGLIDGCFEDIASVWHKDILFALSNGVHVCGAASMGALRAAECEAFGMVGMGAIYRRYAEGDLDDDAAVAELHAPEELGFVGLTEPLVNVEATIEALRAEDRILAEEAQGLLVAARALHFKERTYPAIMARLDGVDAGRRAWIASAIAAGKVDAKRRDAEELVRHLATVQLRSTPPPWQLSMTRTFRSLVDERVGSN